MEFDDENADTVDGWLPGIMLKTVVDMVCRWGDNKESRKAETVVVFDTNRHAAKNPRFLMSLLVSLLVFVVSLALFVRCGCRTVGNF